MCLSIASNRAFGGVPTPSSICTKPMNRGISCSLSSGPAGRWPHSYVERAGGSATSPGKKVSHGSAHRLEDVELDAVGEGARLAKGELLLVLCVAREEPRTAAEDDREHHQVPLVDEAGG